MNIELNVTISIGATEPIAASELAPGWQQYVNLADVALYQAKSQGRNCAVMSHQATEV